MIPDDIDEGYQAGRYWLQVSHRNIRHITGSLHLQSEKEQYQEFCKALEEEGITSSKDRIIEDVGE